MKTLEIRIYGKVQGVWFRASAKEIADRLGVRGFAKNEADGSVRIVAQGEEEAVEEFLAWCEEGPPGAEVGKVEVAEKNHQEDDFRGFSIA